MNKLIIYYDNPTPASDTYLKYLTNDCKNNDIEIIMIDNFDTLKDTLYKLPATPVLPLFPCKDADTTEKIKYLLSICSTRDIDNVSGMSFYKDATAEGIFNHIKENYPDRKNTIAVIGRGKVGHSLIDMLIDYGYTIMEFNSASSPEKMLDMCSYYANVVVGASSSETPIFYEKHCNMLLSKSIKLIDTGNNFETKHKLRCGKWTRQIIVERAGSQV